MTSFFLILLAAVGLIDSGYIFYKKLRNEKLICFIGKDCNKVIKSKYSSVFGIPNELIGIFFYIGILGFVLLSQLGIEAFLGVQLVLLVQAVTFLAFLSSFFLTTIQIFILKEWCEYCLLIAFVNAGIFAFVLFL